MARIRQLTLLLCAGLALAAIGAPAAPGQSSSLRVVGGSPASTATYPWQAALVRASNGSLRCGASLVTSRMVVTAAHCLRTGDPNCTGVVAGNCTTGDPGGDGTVRWDANDFRIVLGRDQLSATSTGTVHDVTGPVVLAPKYSVQTDEHDWALAALATSSGQAPIKLAGGDERALWEPGVPTEASGWGTTSEGGAISDQLRAAVVPIISDQACGSLSVYGPWFIPESMVCAGYLEGGVDTCQGDSGGPLQSPLEGGGYRLVGITSWGSGCAQANAPGVYTRVAEAVVRSDIESAALQLESDAGLSHEDIVGSGGQPRTSPPPPPPPPPQVQPVVVQQLPPTISKKTRFARAVKKCKRGRKRAMRRHGLSKADARVKLNRCKRKARVRIFG